ncbi:MAG: hypothetical protein LKJ50_10515 [Clostridiales bacterium]|nr:hypothetical protein [Clostridiales bacterium]MCI2160790.1 hypothetical protein [Oscillospiraceae bacterium]MCI1962374.1 hypothetical protein [Clostridiales bacterium]MCI2022814.1 hypothetical protein [Clostridiales bacterium]MCI2027211.1 hypothetical protein [Clostridiales bacterium]
MTQTASALTPDSMAGRISIARWKTTCREPPAIRAVERRALRKMGG